MPRVGDVNLTPLEYAESVREKVKKVSPSRLYTYRYIWKTDGKDSLSVRVLTALQEEHYAFRKALFKDENVISATAEYISEIDTNFLLLVEPVKKCVYENKEVKS